MSLAWEEDGRGTPLVLVHGITEDRHAWDTLLPHLVDRYRCVRLDLRGHGESPLQDDQSALAMAGDVAEVVAEAGIETPPVVVGHSLGGVVVTAYAIQAPVAGVVNIDQSLRFGDFATALRPLADVIRGPGFADAVLGVLLALGVDRLSPPVLHYVERCCREVSHEVVLGAWDMVLDADPTELTATAEVLLEPLRRTPYLAIHGSDPGAGYPEWLGGMLDGLELEIWEGAGHFPHLVEPARFADRLDRFVAAHP